VVAMITQKEQNGGRLGVPRQPSRIGVPDIRLFEQPFRCVFDKTGGMLEPMQYGVA